MNKRRQRLGGGIVGVVVLAGAMVLSLTQVFMARKELEPPGKRVIRVAMWQLELGYRDALRKVIDDYEALHPDVKVVMMPVAETVYAQWLNTQLISGEGPDIAELGFSKLVTSDMYTVRFFEPLGEALGEPNPYNRGTPLEGVPWRETFLDGLRNSLRETLQEYYSVPISSFATRLYYNCDLLHRATGSDTLPETFGQFMAACDSVRRLGGDLFPLVSSYHVAMFDERYSVAFTAALEPLLDTDLNGGMDGLETYAGFIRGQVNFRTPRIAAFYEFLRQIAEQMPRGFASMDRQQAFFFFVQGRAMALATGSWDAQSIVRQSAGRFRLGIADYPLPAAGEPFGEYVSGRMNEAAAGIGVPLGIYKLSRHRETALDFLRFLTSARENERFNQLAQWPPVIVGAQPSELMRPFARDPEGFSSRVRFDMGGEVTRMVNTQAMRYFASEISYDELADQVERAMRDPRSGGDRVWATEYDRLARQTRTDERTLAMHEWAELTQPPSPARQVTRRRVLLQQTRRNAGEALRFRFEQLRGKPLPEL